MTPAAVSGGPGTDGSSLPEKTSGSQAVSHFHTVPGPILLLGAPGSGKGTQGKSLAASWGIPQISTGDILRENRARGTELGKAAEKLMGEGKLAPDELVNKMVADRLAQPDTGRGFVLDGYPRTLPQAEWLEQWLGKRAAAQRADGAESRAEAASPALAAIAVNIHVSYTELLRRITGRRNCPTCNRIYNVYLKPPQVDSVCDVDGTPLVARADDVEAVFEERMRVYDAQTAPVVEHYRAGDRFIEVDGERPADEVAVAISAGIERLRGGSSEA